MQRQCQILNPLCYSRNSSGVYQTQHPSTFVELCHSNEAYMHSSHLGMISPSSRRLCGFHIWWWCVWWRLAGVGLVASRGSQRPRMLLIILNAQDILPRGRIPQPEMPAVPLLRKASLKATVLSAVQSPRKSFPRAGLLLLPVLE